MSPETPSVAPVPSTNTLRSPDQLLSDLKASAPPPPTAGELTDKFGTPPSELGMYDSVLEDAEKGELGFDLAENVRNFARNADQRDPATGVGDISVAVNPEETDVNSLSKMTVQMMTHQAHLARSLGFTVHGRMHISDGQAKLRILSPRPDRTPQLTPVSEAGVIVDKAPVYDKSGSPLPVQVAENLYAAKSFMTQEDTMRRMGSELNLESAVNTILGNANHDEVYVDTGHAYYNGGGSFARNVLEAAGYKVGALTSEAGPTGYYKVPILGRLAETDGDLSNQTPRAAAPAEEPIAQPEGTAEFSNGETIDDKNREVLLSSDLSYLLTDAYNRALALEPRLANVEIVPLPEDSVSVAVAVPAWKSASGRHEVHLRLGDSDAILRKYSEVIESVPGARRLFADSLGLEEKDLTPQLLYVQSALHELGHTVEYMQYEQQPEELRARVKKEKSMMPLGSVAVSRLLDPSSPARQTVDAHFDELAHTHEIDSLDELIEKQHAAYRQTTSEHFADSFAADVIALSPSLRDNLISSDIQPFKNYHRLANAA